MKSKFSSIWRVAIALVLVLSFSLVMAVPVSAATAVSSVTVTPLSRLAATTTEYTIAMTTTTNLVGDTDTISIVFPTGITPSATANVASDVTIGGTGGVSPLDNVNKYVVTGQRVTLEVPINKDAGSTPVVIGVATTLVTNPAAGSYQLTVYTSKDTTPVLSTAFIIGGSVDSRLTLTSVTPSPATAGAVAQYTISITTEGTLAAGVGTITITFPALTTVPASISSASYVTIAGGGTSLPATPLAATTAYSGNATTRVVTLTVPADVTAGTVTVVFLIGAGITNPTTIGSKSYTAYTSKEPIASTEATYTIVVGAITKLGFSVNPTQVTPNLPSTVFTVQAQDLYGNLASSSTASVRPRTTSLTGLFYTNANGTGELTTLSLSGGSGSFYYKDTTAGTYTITVAESTPSTPPWTDASTPFAVIVRVALYHGGTLVANFNTIQAAVTAAVAGDTIKAGAGTYDEQLSISKANLTLESTAGAASTIIQPTGTTAGTGDVTITSAAGGTVIKDFTFDFNGTTGTRTGQGIWIAAQNVEIRNNTFALGAGVGSGSLANHVAPGFGILTSGGTDVKGLLVDGNTFVGITTTTPTTAGSLGVWISVPGISGSLITISNNTFSGPLYAGVEVEADFVTVLNNTLTGPGSSLGTYGIGVGEGTLTSIAIEGNSVASFGTAIDVRSGTVTATIKKNSLTGNGEGVYANGAPTLTVKYNDIVANTSGVVRDSGTVNAAYNYWGSATGPTITATNPYGTGNTVSADVTYSPWLHKSNTYVVADNADYPAFRVELAVGWNTLSAPAKLIATADAVDELVPSGVSIAYYYSGGWQLVTTGYVLNPCNAVYIKMTSAKSVLFQIDGSATWVPSKDLAAGWNLIGLASLTTKTDVQAIASVSGSFGQLVSPSMNASEWLYISGGSAGSLVVGEGYWIFMKSAATLGGFTLCPIVPQY